MLGRRLAEYETVANKSYTFPRRIRKRLKYYKVMKMVKLVSLAESALQMHVMLEFLWPLDRHDYGKCCLL